MSGHHKPLLSRQPCRTDPQPRRADPSSPIVPYLRYEEVCELPGRRVAVHVPRADEHAHRPVTQAPVQLLQRVRKVDVLLNLSQVKSD